jgi:hypothetical protein
MCLHRTKLLSSAATGNLAKKGQNPMNCNALNSGNSAASNPKSCLFPSEDVTQMEGNRSTLKDVFHKVSDRR